MSVFARQNNSFKNKVGSKHIHNDVTGLGFSAIFYFLHPASYHRWRNKSTNNQVRVEGEKNVLCSVCFPKKGGAQRLSSRIRRKKGELWRTEIETSFCQLESFGHIFFFASRLL